MPVSEKVEWGSGPVRFELTSDEAEVVSEARTVFANWKPDPDAHLVGVWHVTREGSEYLVDPRARMEDGSDPPTLTDHRHAVAVVEYSAMARIADKCEHVLAFHAALLAKGNRSVSIVGPSHAGKSTLATALWRKGWRFQTDDMTMTVGRTAFAGPRRVALRSESRPHVGDDLWSLVPSTAGYFKTRAGFLFQPMHIDDSAPGRFDLSAVFFLNRNGASKEGKPRRLSPVEGAFALLPYTNLSRIKTFPEAFRVVADLMTDVPAFDLPRAPVTEMISSVEALSETL